MIDFIDMYEMRNNRTIEKKVKELIKKDRARIQISRISQFGLLEMSRQRLRQSFIDWKTELSIGSSALKIIYSINEKINTHTLETHIYSLKKKLDNFELKHTFITYDHLGGYYFRKP